MPADRARLRREALLLLVLIFAGLIVVPISIWFVGKGLFGAYAGDGFGGFFVGLLQRLGSGSWVAWFLVLSPLLLVTAVRSTFAALRLTRD